MTEEKENIIKRLMFLNGTEGSFDDLTKNIMLSIESLVPNISKIDLNNISKSVKDEIMSIYDKNLTDEEILKLIDFYNSDLGKLYVEKMNIIVTESMKIGQRTGEYIYKELSKLKNENGISGYSN